MLRDQGIRVYTKFEKDNVHDCLPVTEEEMSQIVWDEGQIPNLRFLIAGIGRMDGEVLKRIASMFVGTCTDQYEVDVLLSRITTDRPTVSQTYPSEEWIHKITEWLIIRKH